MNPTRRALILGGAAAMVALQGASAAPAPAYSWSFYAKASGGSWRLFTGHGSDRVTAFRSMNRTLDALAAAPEGAMVLSPSIRFAG